MLRADRTALRVCSSLRTTVVPLARAARAFVERRGWTVFGFARLDDYADTKLPRCGRWLNDLAALGRAFEALPALARAATGQDGLAPLGRGPALIVGRVAGPDSVHAWIRLARRVTVRELKEAVSLARSARSSWPDLSACPARPGSAGSALEAEPGSPIEERAGPIETNHADPHDDRSLVCLSVPAPLRVGFHEVLGLHRAVSGCEATVTSFVEALVAEAFAGPHPPDASVCPIQHGTPRAQIESILARSTRNWSFLADASDEPALRMSRDALRRFEACARVAGSGDAVQLHRQLRTLIDLEAELERRLGECLLTISERGGWSRLMFAGVGHYGEQRLGLGRSVAEDLLRVARGLRRLPRLRAAYEEGRIPTEAVSVVLRTLGASPVDAETEALWIERAERSSVKRLREERRALVRQESARPGAEPPRPLTGEAWHGSLRLEPGMTRERLAKLADRAIEAPLADAFLRLRLPVDLAQGFLGAVESQRLRLTLQVHEVSCDESWPDPDAPAAVRASRTFSERCRRLPAWVGLLALLEDYVATWDEPQAVRRRAAETIYRRDGWRCTAPGCTSRSNLHDHHLRFLSRGGSHAVSNRTCVCAFHHQRGIHGGLASARGKAPLGIDWRLGRPDVAESYRNELRRDPLAPAFRRPAWIVAEDGRGDPEHGASPGIPAAAGVRRRVQLTAEA